MSAMIEAERVLREGAQILAEKLTPLGFRFEVTSKGSSSGGSFAEGRFKNGDRELWLSFRYSLGLVRYRKGNTELTHAQYMTACDCKNKARYPSVITDDPLSAFRDLLGDLEFCDAFLSDDGSKFAALAGSYADPPRGFAGLPS
jgi:hypothetical protein